MMHYIDELFETNLSEKKRLGNVFAKPAHNVFDKMPK